MPSADRRAEADWNGGLIDGKGEVTFASSEAGAFPVTWASRTETPDGRTSPEELVAAAHASCYAMAFSFALQGNDTPPESLHVDAVVSLRDKEGGGVEVTGSRLTVRGKVPGLGGDQAKFQELAEAGEQGCPISNLIRGNAQISLDATLES